MHTISMEVTWDPVKARSNAKKHGISFPDAEAVFFDPFAISTQDLGSIDEPRFVGIGMDSLRRVLVVVYIFHENTIRLISARKANRVETRAYGKGIRL